MADQLDTTFEVTLKLSHENAQLILALHALLLASDEVCPWKNADGYLTYEPSVLVDNLVMLVETIMDYCQSYTEAESVAFLSPAAVAAVAAFHAVVKKQNSKEATDDSRERP